MRDGSCSPPFSTRVADHYRDGTLIDGPRASTHDTVVARISVGEEIGGAGDGEELDVAAVLIFDGALDETDRQAVEQYLTDKYLTAPEPPAMPVDLEAVAGDAVVDLSWGESPDVDVVEYRVYRSETPGTIDPTSDDALATVPAPGTTYADTSVVNGTTYYYTVTAVDDLGAQSMAPTEVEATPQNTDEPSSTQFDFDGDGKADVAVFRDGAWFVRSSSGGTPVTSWGIAGDVLVPADYDGDGKTDIAVFRDGAWFVQSSLTGLSSLTYWGIGTDVPVPADYDGDGKADIAVFRDGVWFVRSSSGGTPVTSWGTAGDVPVPADYDGDGKTDIAVFRDGAWFVQSSLTDSSSLTYWGIGTDVAVPADYDGDGKADIAVFRDGVWFVRSSSGGTPVTSWGTAGDVPVPADYDGDGKTDVAVFRDGAWFVQTATGATSVTFWGVGTDIPIPA